MAMESSQTGPSTSAGVQYPSKVPTGPNFDDLPENQRTLRQRKRDEEIKRNVRRGHESLFEYFFESSRAVFSKDRIQPGKPTRGRTTETTSSLFDRFLGASGGRNRFRQPLNFHGLRPGNRLKNECHLVPARLANSNDYHWADVQVIGRFLEDDSVGMRQKEMYRLYKRARQMFKSRPTRLWVHAFQVDKKMIHLWIFDRNGLYCFADFNLDDHERIDTIIAAYTHMSYVELGHNPMIHINGNEQYVWYENGVRSDEAGPISYKLDLVEPLEYPKPIVSLDPIYYHAKCSDSQADFVVKFSWDSDKEVPEPHLPCIFAQRVWVPQASHVDDNRSKYTYNAFRTETTTSNSDTDNADSDSALKFTITPYVPVSYNTGI
ncbi:hypothetical protein G7046_g5256 [Stylonectria norvegica]|nr:hypothetical protein G7046_g5256 [Stylonectria norvegica]